MNQTINQVTELQIFEGQKIINYLFEMREILRDKVIELDKEIERSPIDSPCRHYAKGLRNAYLECLRLLAATDFDKNLEKGMLNLGNENHLNKVIDACRNE